ncbi:MAG TPA: LuxR C-terminal-related transcriptional regulator [Candidatus Dormibacteraeota bacterium]|nr:LuxR C-terminal-related transcriptional regulator [Candidatus Dormibacteraeota bacterium]
MALRRLVGVPASVPAPGAFGTLDRPRLIERLSNALSLRVACLVAPAGYGKSTLVRQYLDRAPTRPSAIVRVPTGGGLLPFAREVALALRDIAPDAAQDFGGAAESARRAPRPELVLADWFAHLLAEHAPLLVIEDADQVHDEESVAFLRELIERAEHSQFIVVSRATPPLPLTSWLAYGTVDFPIDLAELRFRDDEIRAYVERSNLALPEQTLERVVELAEGWPMAATLAARAAARAGGDLRQIEGATREILFDFFAKEIFASLPASVRRFVVETSVFEALEIPLLEVHDRYADARVILDRLLNDGVFVFRDSEDVYRYQGLFRDFARHELQRRPARERREVYVAAAQALTAGERHAEALALLVEADDRPRVKRLVDERFREIFRSGRADALLRALEVLDAPDDAEILALRALVLVRTARAGEVPELVRRVEELGGSGLTRLKARLALATYLSHEIRYAEAMDVVRDETGDAVLPRDVAFDYCALAVDALTALGESDEAQRYLQQMSPLATPAQRYRVAYANLVLSFNRSELSLIERFAEELLAEAEAGRDQQTAARARTCLAKVALMRSETGVVVRHATEAAEAFRRAGDAHSETFALMSLIYSASEAGCSEIVNDAIARLEALVALGLGRWAHDICVPPARALMQAASGDVQAAFESLNACPALPEWHYTTLRIAEIAFYAALAARREDAEARVGECLQRLRDVAPSSVEASRRTMLALIYLAHANLILGRLERGRSLLEQLGRAKGALERKARLLFDVAWATYLQAGGHAEGEERRREALERLGHAGLEGLAGVFTRPGVPVQAESDGEAGAVGSLTKTELALLGLVGAGLASKQIAARLGRSPQTVDKHLSNALRKLGCRSRSEAVALARRQGFLE